MCGIVGYLGAEIPSARFQAALAQLRHRGPYGEGSVALPHGGLAMTRLPMSSAAPTPLPVKTSQGYAAYNGEVYVRGADIHKEIALMLDGMAQGRLPDGMFALASWDAQRATLTLLRDGLGIKPLYYCYRPADGSLAFASEIKPLLTLVGQVAPDYGAIAELVATGVPLSEQTLFSGVRLLQPGERLVFALEDGRAQLLRRDSVTSAAEEAELPLDAALERAVSFGRETFRPSALLLSGGMDSNLLNTYLEPDYPKFHLALEQDAEPMLPQRNLQRVPLRQTDFMAVLRRAVANFGSATRMSSLVMYQQLADAIGDAGYHCVLLGEGADELFWGYPRHVALWRQGAAPAPREFCRAWFGDYAAKAELLAPDVGRALVARIDALGDSALQGGSEAAIDGFDRRYSLEPLLRRADHLLMSRTIEARTPYLHAGVPALAGAAPRIVDGLAKAPLSALLQRRLPAWRYQPKRHFRLPFSHWPQVVEAMRRYLSAHGESLRQLGLVNLTPETLTTIDAAQLFTLTTLSFWQQEYEVAL